VPNGRYWQFFCDPVVTNREFAVVKQPLLAPMAQCLFRINAMTREKSDGAAHPELAKLLSA
jgi:hypothetical protein